ncbi:MAG: TRAP transporter substrate-binding protein DctP [Myxococcota bacterium]
MKRRLVFGLILAALCVLAVPAAPEGVDAQETITLRLATQAPRGSQWHRAFRAWAGSVQEESGGRLRLQFFFGGSQGDERDYVRKMESGQLDGASVTTTGLGQVARPVLVLSAPGLIRTNRQMDRVRRSLGNRFKQEFENAGYVHMGDGDVGLARFFSNRAINRPQDLRQTRPWARPDDPIVNTFYEVVGASPQRAGINELLPGLQTGRINAFPSSALATISLQWHNHATHVTQQSTGVVVGATIIKKEKVEALPEDLRTILSETSVRAHQVLTRSIRRADDRAFTALTEGDNARLTAVDLSANQGDWDRALSQTRQRLAGRLYPADLLQAVERAAGN